MLQQLSQSQLSLLSQPAMFVVHAHPSRYHQRPRRAFNPFEIVLEQAQYSFIPEPAVVDPVEVARARYMHALDEQRAAREAYAIHHLRTFQDEAAAYLRQQQQQQQVLAAREEARQRAIHARRQQIIQARREEELRRRRLQEHEENEFAQALMLAFELANQVQPAPTQRVPIHPKCACSRAAATPTATPARTVAPQVAPRSSSVPVLAPPPRPTPAPQPRVRFSPPQAASPASAIGIPVSRPAATPVPLKSVLKPTAPPSTSPASVRIPIRESKGKASSHIRVNVTATPATEPALSPADAVAALMMLEADLDALTPATTAAPLLKHQLNTILESVDAIESGGHDAVRDVRRALVQRIEEALVAAEQGEAPFARPQRATAITINEPASTRVEVKVRPEPAAVEQVSIPVVVREPVATPPVVVDDLVDVSQPGPAELDVVSSPSVAVEGYVIDDFLVPEVSAPADATVPQHNEQFTGAEPVQDVLDELAPVGLEPSASSSSLAADFVMSSAVDEPATDERDVQVAAVSDETVPQALPEAVADEGATSDDADAVDEPATALPAAESSTTSTSLEPAADAVTGDGARATPDEPTTVASATTRTPSPILPSETPLAASYPPAQTFAAPTHPPVDAGSDGEWERTSGSEGEKSDYEVV